MARDDEHPPAPSPPPPCQSCLGVLYVSSEYGDGAARPVCVGLNRPADPDGSEPYDRREALVRSFAGDYKLICLGAAEYDAPPPPRQQNQKNQQQREPGLPRCVGIEILIAAQRAQQGAPAATTAATATTSARPSAPPPPPPPRYRPPRPPGAEPSRAPAADGGNSAPVFFTALLDAAGVGTGGGAGDGPLSRFARRFAVTADRNLGRMRDAAGRVADVVGVGGGGGGGSSGSNSSSSSSRRPPQQPPPSSSSSSSPPSSGGGGGGNNSSNSNNNNNS